MLSSRAVKILRVMKRMNDWGYREDIEKRVRKFDYLSFEALKNGAYINGTVFEGELPDCDEYGQIVYPQQYHISDKGLAYLEKLSANRWAGFRSWAALLISLLAMIISAIALFRSW